MDDARLIELEIRYMQQQELLQELSDVLYAAGAHRRAPGGGGPAEAKLEGEPGLVDARQQERPPHY